MRHSIAGRTAATAATADHAVCALWNPHATDSIEVFLIELSLGAATASAPTLRRISARGTSGSSVTAAREQHYGYGAATVTGAILDLAAYTVQPTLIGTSDLTSSLRRADLGAAIGAGVIWTAPDGIIIPPGAGLAIISSTAVIFPASSVDFEFND